MAYIRKALVAGLATGLAVYLRGRGVHLDDAAIYAGVSGFVTWIIPNKKKPAARIDTVTEADLEPPKREVNL